MNHLVAVELLPAPELVLSPDYDSGHGSLESPYDIPDENPCHPYFRLAPSEESSAAPHDTLPLSSTNKPQLPSPRQHSSNIDTLAAMPSNQRSTRKQRYRQRRSYAQNGDAEPGDRRPDLSDLKRSKASSDPHLGSGSSPPTIKNPVRSYPNPTRVAPMRAVRLIKVPRSSAADSKYPSTPVRTTEYQTLSDPDTRPDTQLETITEEAAHEAITRRPKCFRLGHQGGRLQAGTTVTDDKGNDINLSEVEYASNGRLLRVVTPTNTLCFCTNLECDLMTAITGRRVPKIDRFGHDYQCRIAAAKIEPSMKITEVHGVCLSCVKPHLGKRITTNGRCQGSKVEKLEAATAYSIRKLTSLLPLPSWVNWPEQTSTTGIFTCSAEGCEAKLTGSLVTDYNAFVASVLTYFAHNKDCFRKLKATRRPGDITRWCGTQDSGHLATPNSTRPNSNFCTLSSCHRSET